MEEVRVKSTMNREKQVGVQKGSNGGRRTEWRLGGQQPAATQQTKGKISRVLILSEG